MHMLALVLIPPKGDAFELVEAALAPHRERYDEETETCEGWWDWWQIGGRFSGAWSDYDPETDPANIEECSTCGGTGKRTDMEVPNGCNGCHGLGMCLKWPTNWVQHDSNQMTTEYAAALGDKLSCYTFVTPDSVEHVPNYGDGRKADKWRQKVRDQIARIPGGRLVVVDYHR